MTPKFVLAAMLLGVLGVGTACTQTVPSATAPSTVGAAGGTTPSRSPDLGDPGARPQPPVSRRSTNTDRPASSSQDGNQPDRAAAGGGAH